MTAIIHPAVIPSSQSRPAQKLNLSKTNSMRKAEEKQPNPSEICGMVASCLPSDVSSIFLTVSSSTAIVMSTFKQEWKQFVKFAFHISLSWFRPGTGFLCLAIQVWLPASCRNTFSQLSAKEELDRIAPYLNSQRVLSLELFRLCRSNVLHYTANAIHRKINFMLSFWQCSVSWRWALSLE